MNLSFISCVEIIPTKAMLSISLAAAADSLHLHPEDALREALGRLADAFRAEDARLGAEGRSLADLPPDELAEIGARILAAAEGG